MKTFKFNLFNELTPSIIYKDQSFCVPLTSTERHIVLDPSSSDIFPSLGSLAILALLWSSPSLLTVQVTRESKVLLPGLACGLSGILGLTGVVYNLCGAEMEDILYTQQLVSKDQPTDLCYPRYQ